MNTGENVNLYLKTVHPDCFKSCFTWRIVSGGGYVDPEFGIETYYHAPPENEDCGRNPTIEANCTRGNMDRITIGINGYGDSVLAYFDIMDWREGAFYQGIVMKAMVRDLELYIKLKPDFATTTIYHRDCSGARIATTHAEVFQIAGFDSQMKPNRLFRRWMATFYSPTGDHFGVEVGPTYEDGKYVVLRQNLAPFVDFKMPTGETLAHWLPWYPRWADKSQPKAGGIVDVRNAGMLDEGCCNQDLILDE